MLENTVLTPQEVAEILKVAKNTVYELIKRGELNGYKVGKKIRVDLKDVEEYKNKTKILSTPKSDSKKVVFALPAETITIPMDDSASYNSNGFKICGQDILLDILSRYLELSPYNITTFRSFAGSYNGLLSLYMGRIQAATAHLWDSDSGQYNIPYVRRLLPGIPTVIIHLACRMQGFYVAKGNPKNINNWEDLKRHDIKIINREKGCGTRILLDEHLKLLGIPSYKINGYDRECFSHLAVASTVARGGADFALGNEKTSLQVKAVDFIPIQKERYEMVIKKEDMEKPQFKALFEIIRSDAFKKELIGLGGYDLSETGDIVAEL